MAKKVAALLPELERHGEIYLFAMGERENRGQWDVIVSSAWSDENYAASVRIVAGDLAKRLDSDELLALASISIIQSSEPDIVNLPKNLEAASPDEERIVDLTLMDLEVRRAFIFKARRPPKLAPVPA